MKKRNNLNLLFTSFSCLLLNSFKIFNKSLLSVFNSESYKEDCLVIPIY